MKTMNRWTRWHPCQPSQALPIYLCIQKEHYRLVHTESMCKPEHLSGPKIELWGAKTW